MKLRNLFLALMGALVALALVAVPSYADLIAPEDHEPLPVEEEEKGGLPLAAVAGGAAVIAAGAAVFIIRSRKTDGR